MLYQDISQTNQILHRSRVNSLIHENLKQPLLIVLAGPGYGKTQAISSYISACDAAILWLRLGILDNLSSHFWDHLKRSLKKAYPKLSSHLQELEFPNTVSAFNSFIQLIKNNFCGQKPLIWVFDDYGEINNQQIKSFIRTLVEANLENFHLVLISNVLENLESIASITNKQSLLSADDLRFTKNEIFELYQIHNIMLEPHELDMVEYYTEGWPLSLRLLISQHDSLPDLIYKNERLTHHAISLLFEERFFSTYTQQQKKLLVMLSMPDFFTEEFALSLCSENDPDWHILNNHAFLINEPLTDRVFFHHLYRLFLREKLYLLNQKEEQYLWKKAAEYYMKREDIIDAVVCYRKCEDHAGMLQAIDYYIETQNEISQTTAAYFLEHIKLLTTKQINDYPQANYLQAWLYMILAQLEESEAILLDLEKRLLEKKPLNYDLLCDIYSTLGFVHMLQNKEDFGKDFKKAANITDHLPSYIYAKKGGKMRMQNVNAFFMADNLPGAKERMEHAVYDAIPWITKVWSGDMSGMEYIFSAESAYLSFQLNDAEQYAYRCLHKAKSFGQHDLVCNAYRLLSRISYMQGDFFGMKKQIGNVTEYAKKYDTSVVRKLRDTALSWYYIKLRDHKNVPNIITELPKMEVNNLSYGRLHLTYAHYLLNTGEFAKLVAMMEHPKDLYLSRGMWQERIACYLMLAVGNHCLENYDAAMDALWSAYDMCYHNGLVTLFIEAGEYMNKMIQTARHYDKYAFSREWLDFMDRETSAFAKRANKVRTIYYQENSAPTDTKNPLSKREREVLQAIAQGLTREEIAIEQHVSVNTVKSTIRNIYNKLNANNKADAVSIAMTNGYIGVT